MHSASLDSLRGEHSHNLTSLQGCVNQLYLIMMLYYEMRSQSHTDQCLNLKEQHTQHLKQLHDSPLLHTK